MTTLKHRLADGEVTIGSWISFASPDVCEMMARADFDWLVIDMEHTGIGTSEMLGLIRVIESSGKVPIVRVGANDSLLIKRALDCGAHGIVVPMVCSAEDAREAVSAASYPPDGSRGVGLFRAQNYGAGFAAYQRWVSENIVVIVQIEHKDAVRDIEGILATDGVDGFIIGPYDLSASYGKPGEFEDREVRQGLDTVRAMLHRQKKAGGIHIVHPDSAVLEQRISEGYRFIAYGGDMLLFSALLQDMDSALEKARKSGKAESA